MRVQTARARSRGRSFGCGIALATTVIVLSLVLVISTGVFLLASARHDVAASLIPAQGGSIPWDGKTRLNALFVLTDTSNTGRGALDADIVVSYDPRSRHLGILGIPGSLWVTIPGYGPGRIDQAYNDGGIRTTLLTVQGVLRRPIPYYAVFGSDGFRKVIDGFGGITVQVPQSMTVPSADGSGAADRIMAGRQRLDGATALAYTRASAGDALSDIDRTQRQEQLLLAIKHQGFSADSLVRIPGILNSVGGSIDTNFPFDQIPALSRAIGAVPDSATTSGVLDYESGSVTNYSASGTDVLLPDWQRIQSLARRLFPDPSLSGTPVEVINSSGITGQAATLAAWLVQIGINVNGYASSGRSQSATTRVLLQRGAGVRAQHIARALAGFLQAPIVTGSVSNTGPAVVVVIGRDYQDISQE